MATNNNFSSFNSREGFGPFYWWMGQIVDEKNWDGNTSDVQHDRNDIPGWGYRYKVRIFGRDSLIKDVPDEQLEMAEVVYPVTAGSGHGGSGQTPNIRQGAYVIGFYKDGKNAKQPVIMGLLGNNSQTELPGADQDTPLAKRSGWFGQNGTSPVPNNKIWREPGSSSQPTIDSGHEVGHADQRLKDQYIDGKRKMYAPPTYGCDGSSGGIQGVQIALESTIGFLSQIQSAANTFSGAVSDVQNSVTSVINRASAFISNQMKTIYNRMRGFVNNAVDKVKSLAASLTPPFLRNSFNTAASLATDILQCAFNTSISSLFSTVLKSITSAVKKFLSAPTCAVEQITSSILTSGLGGITSGIGSALSGISSMVGSVGNILSGGFGVMDIISGAIKLLTCSKPLDCTVAKEWSLWYGVKDVTRDVKSISDNLSKSLNSSVDSVLAVTTGSSKSKAKSSKSSASSSSSSSSCNTGPTACGPPTVVITGGGGSGAKANAIISSTGKLLGLDWVSYGSGYTSAPTVTVQDPCGNGNGSVIVPVMNFPTTTVIA